jgi:hypothetical protein
VDAALPLEEELLLELEDDDEEEPEPEEELLEPDEELDEPESWTTALLLVTELAELETTTE